MQQHRQQRRIKTLVLALAAAFPALVAANPLDPSVAAGHATFATSGNTLSVTNTPGTVIDWRAFSIGEGEVTRFIQQSAASQVLNRIHGGDPTVILGSLQSNGQVFLINPSGIVFGANARVDVAGLVASTLGISNENFLAGRLDFSAPGAAGSIRNDGQLQALGGGSIFLIAPTVENHGIVRAPDGAVVLAAGKQATLVDSNRPDVRVEISAPSDAAINVGQLVGGHVGIYAGAIRNEGTVSATGASVDANGTVVFRGSASVINDASGTITASGDLGGAVRIEAPSVSLAGRVAAGGISGGTILVDADRLTQSGAVAANGTTGHGGQVTLRALGGIAQTLSAQTTATGANGGTIELRTGDAGRLYSSGTIDTSGTHGVGGSTRLIGGDIVLAGATLLANGAGGGGSILVGGGARGEDPAIANSRMVYASLGTTVRADGVTAGDGGEIVFWSEGATRVGATLSARGGNLSGDGGSIEVSGRESTAFGGTASAAAPRGTSGTFLIDPKNIIIDDVVGGVTYRDLFDPNPNTDGVAGNGYGNTVELFSGNTLITDPYDNAMGARSGAIYLYRGSDGALLTTLTGAAANDGVGLGQRISSGGNLLLMHSAFGSGDGSLANAMGAVTWLNPNTGLLANGTASGVVSSANSLVGTTIGDRVGRNSDFFPSPFSVGSSKVVIASPHWNAARGAMTWLDVATGRLSDGSAGGAVSTVNSLVGSNAGDRVGASITGQPITPVTGSAGGVFLISEGWNSVRGAVTWMDGNTGRLTDGTTGGAVSASNSLVGENAGDRIGYGRNTGSPFFTYRPSVQALGSGMLFFSPYYGSAGNVDAAKGAVTWINSSTGRLSDGSTGSVIGAANSLMGAATGDRVGVNATSLEGDFQMSGGRALIYSSRFGTTVGDGTVHRGAVTWIDGTNGRLSDGSNGGIVSTANSFVGTNIGDGFANTAGRTTVGGRVMLQSPDWNAGRGAITWIDIATGRAADGSSAGAIGATNSIVGGAPGDRVGTTVTRVASGNYVILAPFWDDLANDNPDAGAVAWMSSTGALVDGATTGTLSLANALVGADAFDRTGENVTLVESINRNFVISTPTWNGGRGAVTWINGTTGRFANGAVAAGIVGTANSVYGTTEGDAIGADVRRLSNGNVLLVSPNWTNTGIDNDGSNAGAVTWISGSTGLLASMTSTAGFNGVANAVGFRNSLVGNAPGTLVGSGGIIEDSSYLIVRSPSAAGSTQTGPWSGAVTWMSASTGALSNMGGGADYLELGGNLSSANSLLDVGTPADTRTGFGARLFLNTAWNGGRGSLTWMGSNGRLADGTAGGFVSTDNSVLGTTVVEGAALSVQALSGTNHFVLLNPLWSAGGETPDAGAVTWISGQTGRLANGEAGGFVSDLNSIVGGNRGDRVGSDGVQRLHTYDATGFIVRSSHWQYAAGDDLFEDAGAITWFNSSNGLLAGMTSAADFAQQTGFVSASNSIVGDNLGDRIGGDAMSLTEIGYYYSSPYRVFIRHGDFNGGRGAITWVAAATGRLSDGTFGGEITNANSLRGNANGDAIGNGGIQQVGSNDFLKYLVLSPDWSDGGTKPGAGAVTWIDGATGQLSTGATGGTVSSANSLVGGTAGDRVGSGGVQMVSSDYYETRYLISSPEWNRGGTQASAGAVTWINTTSGTLIDDTTGGLLSESNSLVGSVAGERLGDFGAHEIGNGKYLLRSLLWSDGGTKANAGALTWFDGQTGTLATGASLTGLVTIRNSLVGRTAGDQIGSGNIVTWLGGEGVLAYHPEWSDGGSKTGAGAVTWIHRDTGRLANMASASDYATLGGGIDATNSLVGGAADTRAGGEMVNVYDYNIGQYVLRFQEQYRDLGNSRALLLTTAHGGGAGAITWIDMASGLLANGSAGGVIGAANSVVGDRAGDDVANASVIDDGYYGSSEGLFIRNAGWHDSTGAVTWMHRDTGLLIDGTAGGVVSAANSLVGSASGDRIGANYSSDAYDSGGYVFWSDRWSSGRGAVTWIGGNGLLAGMTDAADFNGTVSAANSLVGTQEAVPEGSTGDRIGSNSVFLQNGSSGERYFVVHSSGWDFGRGAITRIDAATGRLIDGSIGGTPSSANSLVGANAGDAIGGAFSQSLGSGNHLIHSTTFGANRGSVTLMDRDWSLVGVVSRDNSVIGNQANAGLQANNFSSSNFQQDFTNGTSLIRFRTDGAGRIVVLSNSLSQGSAPPVAFDAFPGSDVTVSPGIIAAMLNDGTRVRLEATNDIIVRKAITATGTTTDDGALELRAGRHIAINANITNHNQDDSGLSFIAHANLPLSGSQGAYRDAGVGNITSLAGVTVTTTGGVDLRAANIGTGAVPMSINTATNASVTALTSVGDIFLRQLGGPTRLSLLDLDAPVGRLIQFDSAGQALVIDTAINVTNGANLHLIGGGSGLEIRSNITSNGNVTLEASSGTIRVSDVRIRSDEGALTLRGAALEVTATNQRTIVRGETETRLEIAGNVMIRGGGSLGEDDSSASATLGSGDGLCVGTIGGNLTIIGGSGNGASATLFGGPDIGTAQNPLQVGGVITLQSGTGEGALARIAAASPDTIHINFPNLTSGGYTVDGQPVTALNGSGFYANDNVAILNDNLFFTYGSPGSGSLLDSLGRSSDRSRDQILADIENAGRSRWLAKSEANDQPILPACR